MATRRPYADYGLRPAVLLGDCLSGDTAVEACWMSVLWPAQGMFIGEPLASPYRC